MPTGIKPYRRLFFPTASSWTTTNLSSNITQILYTPFYQIRNCPDRIVKKYINTSVIYVTAASRQRMANNGYYVEVCGNNVTDGPMYADQRPFHYIWTFAGATNDLTSIARGAADYVNDKNYTGSCGNVLHELNFAELTRYFPAGQRPAGHTTDVSIFDWSEVQAVKNDCNNNGFADTGSGFTTQMRVSQRIENTPIATTTIPFNATASQVQAALETHPYISTGGADVSVGGGPLPTAITIDFIGQYAAHDIVQMAVATNSLTGTGTPTPVITTTTNGSMAKSGTYQDGTTFNISAANERQTLTITGTATAGTFTLNFYGGVDRMLDTAGPGTNHGTGGTGGTPQSRVNTWLSICSTNGWNL